MSLISHANSLVLIGWSAMLGINIKLNYILTIKPIIYYMDILQSHLVRSGKKTAGSRI
jgi:hypothetical protein